jgi:misacylated tRNA(Ala) deacylase
VTEGDYLFPIDAAYERKFKATVVARPPGAVVLDRTLFYPVGGGQPCDQGWITGAAGAQYPVKEVRKSGGTILHHLGRSRPAAAPPLSQGEEVTGEIDWERRYRHMRLHTSQHFVSAVVFAQTGRRTRSATMKGDHAAIELEGSLPLPADWASVEGAIRSELRTPRTVRIELVPRKEWDLRPSERSGLVPLAPQVDPVRVLVIDGVDRCPCGGTHLRSTAEIGEIYLEAPVAQPTGVAIGLKLRGASDHSARVTP